MTKPETRTIAAVGLEARREGKRAYIEGRIPYNSRSELLYAEGRECVEIIAPTAFKRTLNAGSDVKLLWDHNSSEIMASSKAGTLKLEDRADGLYFCGLVPDSQMGRFETVARGDLDACSFGFLVDQGGATWDYAADPPVRTVRAARLLEISPTPWPAYPESSTTAALRSKARTGESSDSFLIALELASELGI